MRKVKAIIRIQQTENDLYNRTQYSGTIKANKPDVLKRANDIVQQFESSYVVDLNKKDIPSFLYDSSGKLI